MRVNPVQLFRRVTVSLWLATARADDDAAETPGSANDETTIGALAASDNMDSMGLMDRILTDAPSPVFGPSLLSLEYKVDDSDIYWPLMRNCTLAVRVKSVDANGRIFKEFFSLIIKRSDCESVRT